MEKIKFKEAVTALIYTENGKIIGVSRKYDSTKFGLPGGKRDHGETRIAALYREIIEETGLKIKKHKFIFKMIDDCGYRCYTYLCQVEGEIKTKEIGVVKEVTWEELFSGPFGDYNRNLYNKIK